MPKRLLSLVDRKEGSDLEKPVRVFVRRRLIAAAALDLYEAARLLEYAEEFHANCPDCDGDGVPECCETCFPLFDEARLKRRAALEKAGCRLYEEPDA